MRLSLLLILVAGYSLLTTAAEIHEVAEHGDLAKLKALLSHDGTLVKAKDKAGNQPLHAAAMKGNVEVMRTLLDAGAEVNAKGFDDWTPLHYAAKSQSAKACTLLLERGADKEALNGVHRSPLQVAQGGAASAIRDYTPKVEGMDKVDKAIKANDVTVLKALLSSNPALIKARNTKGLTPLLNAVKSRSDLGIIKALLEAGADLRATDKSGASALGWATETANADAADLLFQFKVEATKAGEFDELLMMACSEVNWAEVSKTLKASKETAKPEAPANARQKYWAVVNKHPASMERAGNLRRIAAMLVEHGANPNAISPSADTALKLAAKNATPDALKFLLNHGAEPNQRGAKEQALQLAISSDHQEHVQLLLDAGADPLFGSETEQSSALDLACLKGDLAMAKRLLGCIKEPSRLASAPGPLLAAAMSGSTEMVRLLLKHGADARGRNNNGDSALMYAMFTDSPELTAELIAAGADVNAMSNIGFTPLAAAADHNRTESIKLLLDHGAKLELPNNRAQTPLMYAAGTGALEAAQLLVKAGANLKAVDAKGETAISLAAASGRTAVMKLLLDAGVPMNGGSGGSPLTLLHLVAGGKQVYRQAASSESGEINGTKIDYNEPGTDADYLAAAELLLARGADVNASASMGATPLHIAAIAGGTAAMVLFLLDHGADIEAVQGSAKLTPFLCGVESGSEEVMDALLKRGADINAKASNGLTATHVAAYYDQPAAADFLLRHGVSVDARDDLQRTPLMSAARQGSMKMVKFLIEHHADAHAVGDYEVTALKEAINNSHYDIADYLSAHGAKE